MSLNIKTDEQLAELLGVSRPTVSSWKIRNSIDYSLIFETFPELDLNLIIKGVAIRNTENTKAVTVSNSDNSELLTKIQLLESKIEDRDRFIEMLITGKSPKEAKGVVDAAKRGYQGYSAIKG